MKLDRRKLEGKQRSGFTLAEVAVTIVIVGMALVLCLQGLNGSKLQAAYTRNYKLARELGLGTLGEVGSGMWAEDVAEGLEGSYAGQGHPEFSYELVVGDDSFRDDNEFDESERFDSWKKKDDDEEEDDEEADEQPYEKVKIRIYFTQIQEYPSNLTLEQWFPWDQVYGSDEEQAESLGA